MLLGLARGSGGRSLAGMRRAFDHYRRPLLDLSRADTVAACEAEGIEFWSDPHNEDPRFARSRVRHRGAAGPRGASSARASPRRWPGPPTSSAPTWTSSTTSRSRRSTTWATRLPVDDLAAQPAPVRRRVLRLAALAAGAPASELFHEHVLAMDALITDWHGQQWIDLPGHLRFLRREGHLGFERTS